MKGMALYLRGQNCTSLLIFIVFEIISLQMSLFFMYVTVLDISESTVFAPHIEI